MLKKVSWVWKFGGFDDPSKGGMWGMERGSPRTTVASSTECALLGSASSGLLGLILTTPEETGTCQKADIICPR